MPARKRMHLSLVPIPARGAASVDTGCFLGLSCVCQLKRTALSKSSTLTRTTWLTSRTDGRPMALFIVWFQEPGGKKYAFDTGMKVTVSYQLLSPRRTQVLLFLDQIKREKGVW